MQGWGLCFIPPPVSSSPMPVPEGDPKREAARKRGFHDLPNLGEDCHMAASTFPVAGSCTLQTHLPPQPPDLMSIQLNFVPRGGEWGPLASSSTWRLPWAPHLPLSGSGMVGGWGQSVLSAIQQKRWGLEAAVGLHSEGTGNRRARVPAGNCGGLQGPGQSPRSLELWACDLFPHL